MEALSVDGIDTRVMFGVLSRYATTGSTCLTAMAGAASILVTFVQVGLLLHVYDDTGMAIVQPYEMVLDDKIAYSELHMFTCA